MYTRLSSIDSTYTRNAQKNEKKKGMYVCTYVLHYYLLLTAIQKLKRNKKYT